MNNLERFCPQCARVVVASVGDHACPDCGRLTSFAHHAPTLDMSDMSSTDSVFSTPSGDGFAESLLSRNVGHYEIESLLGKGGMAWVFLARHNTLHRSCAVKVLCPELLGRKADSLDLFMVEARTAASLVHPHIVAIHNVGELESHHFIEMEYVPGSSLEQLISDRSSLSLLDATNFLMQTCSALAAAHRQGLAHRDFKPANILVRPDGTAKLADFGLAKQLTNEPETGNVGLAGTPQFMAPELFKGAHANQQTDIYAVGVSYYYALTGRFPFVEGTIAGLAQAHADQPFPDPRSFRKDFSDEAVAIIARCLAKKPEDRFEDSSELLSELQRLFNGMRDFPSLVNKALAGMSAELTSNAGRIIATVRLAEGRSQRVHIDVCPAQLGESRLIRISSICAPVDEAYFRRALEFNATMPHGALAIQNIDGEPHFVMLNSYLQATCEAEDIRRSVQEIARWSDNMEQILTGRDDR
jgi:eukaryotic-like serine/threonine-protein kinase